MYVSPLRHSLSKSRCLREFILLNDNYLVKISERTAVANKPAIPAPMTTARPCKEVLEDIRDI
jgi:hypothetical protein